MFGRNSEEKPAPSVATKPASNSSTLAPEDVVNKRFQPTRFREGYDQDEVDDFLDEIVVTMRNLAASNEKLARENSRLKHPSSAKHAAPPATT